VSRLDVTGGLFDIGPVVADGQAAEGAEGNEGVEEEGEGRRRRRRAEGSEEEGSEEGQEGGEAVIAAIRERMEPPADVPDGPPLSPVERARFRLRLADGVESAYAAVYGDTADRLTIVLGLKHTNDPHVAVKVSPAAGACADAVGVHVKTVTQR
jgi:hypothetical protein